MCIINHCFTSDTQISFVIQPWTFLIYPEVYRQACFPAGSIWVFNRVKGKMLSSLPAQSLLHSAGAWGTCPGVALPSSAAYPRLFSHLVWDLQNPVWPLLGSTIWGGWWWWEWNKLCRGAGVACSSEDCGGHRRCSGGRSPGQWPHFSSQQRSRLPREKHSLCRSMNLGHCAANDSKVEEPLSEQQGERQFGQVPASQQHRPEDRKEARRNRILDGPVCEVQVYSSVRKCWLNYASPCLVYQWPAREAEVPVPVSPYAA